MKQFEADAAMKKLQRDKARAAEEKRMREQGYIFVANHEPARVHKEVYATVTPSNARVRIDLSEQRAYLMNGNKVALETPVATGKASTPTPTGSFSITEKDIDHRSNLYGDYVDSNGPGRPCRGGHPKAQEAKGYQISRRSNEPFHASDLLRCRDARRSLAGLSSFPRLHSFASRDRPNDLRKSKTRHAGKDRALITESPANTAASAH